MGVAVVIRKKALVLTGLILALALTGCSGSSRAGIKDEGWSSRNVGTPDGKSVNCVIFDGYDGDAISCDWDGRK